MEYATVRDEQRREWAVRRALEGLSHSVRNAALRPSLLTLNFPSFAVSAATIHTCHANAPCSLTPSSTIISVYSPRLNGILHYIGHSVESFAMEASVPASILFSTVLTIIV